LRNLFKNVILKSSFNASVMGKMPFILHGEVATWEIVSWEVAACEIAHLGSFHLGNCPW